MRFRRVGAAVTAAAVGGVLAVVPVGAAAAAVDEGLVLHYALTGEGSTAAVDLSGSGRDATIVGDAVVGADGLTFDGVDDYVDLPDNLTTGMDAISVSFDVLVDPALSGNHFMFNLGNAAVGNPQSGSGYLFMTNNATLLAKISDAAWGAEQAVTGPAALPRSTWKHVTYTLAEGTGRLYVDGTEVATNGAITHIPADLGDGVTTANYLGRSAYAPDGLFKGKMKDFRLYDRALSVDEVTDLTAANAAVNLAADVAGLSLGDTSAVTADLTLPSAAPGGSAVSWETSDSAVVTAAGVVSQDAPGGAVRTATLTATLTHRGLTDTATFEITVLPAADDASLAQAAADALVVHNLDDVRGNLTLPTTGEHAATVTWASSAPPRRGRGRGHVDRDRDGRRGRRHP